MRALLLIAIAGCGGTAPDPEPPRSTPGTGEAYTSINPAPEIDALASDFRGSCAFARPPGEVGDYASRITARGGAMVRATASFDPDDRDNVIGELPAGVRAAAAGPIAQGGAGDRSAGVGYAVLLRDGEGRVCRGYVLAGEVDVLSSARCCGQ